MQKDGTLGVNRAKDDYLLQPFQDGKLIMINIPLPREGGKEKKNRNSVISEQMTTTMKQNIRDYNKGDWGWGLGSDSPYWRIWNRH